MNQLITTCSIYLMRIGQNKKFRSFYKNFFFILSRLSQGILKNSGNLVFIIASLMSQGANAQTEIEKIEQLRQQVAQFLTEEYQKTDASKIDIKVGGLDSRLRLSKCTQALALNLQDPEGNGGNITVQVVCRGTSNWTILVPAQAIIYRSMAVASRNLQRGELVTAADIVYVIQDASQYHQGYNNHPDEIIGKALKLAINKGEAFRSSALDAPLAIKRGEVVSVEAMAGSIRVVTTGTAITDGRLGQQVRIKNNQSERTLSATVIGPGKVQNLL